MKRHWSDPECYIPVIGVVIALGVPFVMGPYYLNVIIMIFLFAALGTAWNLIGGYGGQTSLGHAAFFGLGAYASSILAVQCDLSPWIGMAIGALLSVILSLGIGAICFRLRGHYFAIATIMICELLRLMFLRERWLTGGGVGLSVPFKGNSFLYLQFLDKAPYYYISLGLLLLIMYVTYRISRSKMGYYLKAIGQNQEAAEVIGIDAAAVKRKTLAISAFFTSICGTFWAQYMFFIDPEIGFGINLSIEIACIAIIGGIGTVVGPLIGAMVLRPIVEITLVMLGSTYSGVQLIVYGVILIVIVILRPIGLVSWVAPAYCRMLRVLPGGESRRGTN